VNFPFYIARRYLVSKKSHNIINIISWVSVIGVMIGTMALVVILSVFNGFEDLVTKLFNTFNPDLQITVKEGKVFTLDEIPADSIKNLAGIVRFTEVVEENALLKYRNKQYIATIKGVSDEYQDLSGLDTMMVEGDLILQAPNSRHAVVGYGIAYYLTLNLRDYTTPISVYVPKRTRKTFTSMDNAFNNDVIFPAGIFSIQQDFDSKYMLVPISFARELLEYEKEVSSVEIGLEKGIDTDRIQKTIEDLIGEQFEVKNRFQQQEMLYKIMKSEKWAIFLILTFILLIATFNVIGSLSMLIIDKKKDIAVLWSMGANNKVIKRIFLTEGLLISVSGAILGVVLGSFFCWLQQRFGLISLGGGSGSFVIDAYPVKMVATDILYVFLTVFLIGLGASYYPVRQISKKFLKQKLA